MAFASTVREERVRRGFTQEALAYASDITASEISRIERAQREPRLLTVIRLAGGLGMTAGELLNGMDK
jgi:transcriptional regulator with XRE-family HTH domain